MTVPHGLANEILAKAANEGSPRLIPGGDLSGLPIPGGWREVAESPRPGVAAGRLWHELEPDWPRLVGAIGSRLTAAGVLITDEVPASLLYLFQDADESTFVYRGFPPVERLPEPYSKLPQSYQAVHRVHDGWWLFFSEEDGFRPSNRELRLTHWLDKISLRLSPRQLDPADFLVVYESSPAYVIGFDLARPSIPAYRVWDTGEADLLPDPVLELETEIAEFLEQLPAAR